MKKVKLISALLLFALFCSVIPLNVFAIETKTVVVIDGTGMIGKYQLLTPTIENNSDYYVYDSQWYMLDENQQEGVNFGQKIPGGWYKYRLTLVVYDPNAFANECYIMITGVDWREEWGTTNGEIGGQRALIFEGLYHAHKCELVKGEEPTCTKGGIKDHYLCACGCHTYDEFGLEIMYSGGMDSLKLPPIEHESNSLPYVSAVKPTCENEGVIGHWHCPYCNNDFDFNDGGKNVSGKTVAPALGHKDENNDGKCDTCGKVLQTVITTENPDTSAISPETTATPDGTEKTQVPETIPSIPETTQATERNTEIGFSVSTVAIVAVVAMLAGACISIGTVLVVKKIK